MHTTNKPTLAILETPLVDGSPQSYRFRVVAHHIYIFSFVTHGLLLAIFLLLRADVLAVYNLVSCSVFALCLRMNRTPGYRTAFLIGALEVVVHSTLCVLFIGWETGFHYFILGIIPFCIVVPDLSLPRKVMTATALVAVYGVLYLVAVRIPVQYALSASIVQTLKYANLVVTFAAFSFLVHFLSQASEEAERRVRDASRTDYLTGVLNRRGMAERLEAARATALRSAQQLSVIIGDLDHFKQVNDRYGHNCGDRVLVQATECLQTVLRNGDVVSRWGGEEFLILLPDTSASGALTAGEKLLQSFRSANFVCSSVQFSMTITLGAATFRGDESVEALIGRADRALYSGKQAGRNRLVCDSQRPEERSP